MFSIDVSEYNGEINWPVTAPLVELAIVKAVGTYGTSSLSNVDPMFARNWAVLAGYPNILRGAYLFLYMNDDPAVAASQFLDTVKPRPSDLVVVDLEDQESLPAIKGKGTGALWPFVKITLDVLEKGIGKKPFIYTSAGWWNYYLCKVVPGKSITPPPWTADYPLWVANYTLAKIPKIPAGFKEWLIWQYGSDKVPGCGVSVGSNPLTDVNRLSLTVQQLAAKWNPPPAVVPPPPVVDLTLEQKVAILWQVYQAGLK
jgi:lysozyme